MTFLWKTSTSSWWVLDIFSLFDMPAIFGLAGAVWARSWGRGIRNCWKGGLCGFRGGSLAGGSRTPLPAPAILAGAMRRAARRRCLVQTSLCALARKALIKERGYCFFWQVHFEREVVERAFWGQLRPVQAQAVFIRAAHAASFSFFSGSGTTSGATASSGWSVGRWPGDAWGIGMDPVSCFLFPFHCWLRIPGHWLPQMLRLYLAQQWQDIETSTHRLWIHMWFQCDMVLKNISSNKFYVKSITMEELIERILTCFTLGFHNLICIHFIMYIHQKIQVPSSEETYQEHGPVAVK